MIFMLEIKHLQNAFRILTVIFFLNSADDRCIFIVSKHTNTARQTISQSTIYKYVPLRRPVLPLQVMTRASPVDLQLTLISPRDYCDQPGQLASVILLSFLMYYTATLGGDMTICTLSPMVFIWWLDDSTLFRGTALWASSLTTVELQSEWMLQIPERILIFRWNNTVP